MGATVLKALEHAAKGIGDYASWDIETITPENTHVWTVGLRTADGYRKWSTERNDESIGFLPHAIGGPIDSFLRYLIDATDGGTYYAHNAGNFDLQFVARWLVEWAEHHHCTAELIPLSSSIMALELRQRRGRRVTRWKFLDSARVLPMSLDEVAKTFGLPSKKVPEGVDKDAFYAELPRNPERWEYLRTDVDILYAAVGLFEAKVTALGGSVAISGASTAMRTYRQSYMSSDIVINRHFSGCDKPEATALNQPDACTGCQHDFFRASYYGGRVEVFFNKPFALDVDVHYGDVNSMYPNAMLNYMPVERSCEDKTRYKAKWEREIGFVDATVTIPHDCYVPPLPYRHGNQLLFPVGRFRGTWEATELALVEQVGGQVEEVHRAVWMEGARIFYRYVRELYKLRDKSLPEYDSGTARVAKDLLNCLYGKYGSHYAREKIWIAPTPDDMIDHDMHDIGDKFHTLFAENILVYPDYLIPQVASRVTALSRVQLWGLLWTAYKAGARLFYCDTDSEVTTHLFPWSTELGGLKLEKTARTGHFVAPKLYRFGDIEAGVFSKENEAGQFLKAKGFGKGFGGKVTHPEWESLVSGEGFDTRRLTKLKSWAAAGSAPGVIRAPKKRSEAPKEKRFFFSDGNSRPWIVDGDAIK